MAENSAIEWTHHTFNPWIGCTKVGPGCDNCYAADLSKARLGVKWGAGAERRHTAASTWKQPRAWNRKAQASGKRYRVFCASLADVFDNEVPAEWRAELFQLIRETPHLDWLLVTKRIGNAAKMAEAAGGWPDNIWLGATVVNQMEADRDVPKLLWTEGPKFRFLSIEPMQAPIDLTSIRAPREADEPDLDTDWRFDALDTGDYYFFDCGDGFTDGGDGPYRDHRIDWVIVGGESGPNARPMHPDWARSLRDQCSAACLRGDEAPVPFLFKQWGEWAPMDAAGIASDRPVSDRCGNVRDWMNRYVVADGDAWARRVRGHTFTGHGTDLVYRVGKKEAGRLLDGIQHDGYPGEVV
ncbi:phage Gp37/Gp68 family protein [Sphingobium yanoikuyae]|uniref:phage Gp37/Gp68 family protein n=1 Tax=Sphingobium yanoikuyae TaxID=13690 RepID=UPI0035C79413